MLIRIPSVLNQDQVNDCRQALAAADWVDGRVSAGYVASRVKANQELSPTHPVARQLGELILNALWSNPLFRASAFPQRICPPFFNRYAGGGTYGLHNDGALVRSPTSPEVVRGDISATLFLTRPEDYDGGELEIEDTYGWHRAKLPAGDLILYPASSLHQVTAVTRGARVSSFFWVQSMIRDESQRTLLLSLDQARSEFYQIAPDNPGVTHLLNIYHNLMRMWADT